MIDIQDTIDFNLLIGGSLVMFFMAVFLYGLLGLIFSGEPITLGIVIYLSIVLAIEIGFFFLVRNAWRRMRQRRASPHHEQ